MPGTSKMRAVAVNRSGSIGPWLDLVVGCGAWSVPLLLLAYFSSAASTLTWSIVVLRPGIVLQLSALHGDHLSRLSHARGFRKISNLHRPHHAAAGADSDSCRTSGSALCPLIFTIYLTASPWHYSGQNYGLFMMFARRAGGTAHITRAARPLRSIPDLVRSLAVEPPHRAFCRSSVRLAQHSRGNKLASPDRTRHRICGLLRFRTVPADLAGRIPQNDPVAHPLFYSVRLVPGAHPAFAAGTIPGSAEPL